MVYIPTRLAATLLALPLLARGVPLVDRGEGPSSDEATTAVSDDTINANFVRPAQFARIAYCSSDAVEKWDCGEPCQALGMGDVEPLVVGGDGGRIPRFFVAHDKTTQSLVVAHQGTDASNVLSVINDAEFILKDINSTLFPKAGSGVQVHDGFAWTQERTADTVLATVKAGLVSKNVSKVAVTGHSLGAAIATMDALMLKMNLDPSVEISTVVFGLPRGGNSDYANLIDSTLGSSFTFITHKNDPVPTVPPRFIGYQHSSGEVHISQTDAASGNATVTVACPGQENSNCVDGNSLFSISIPDHIGPYFANVSMSGKNCPL
ncbi:hypothetical protein EVG20_g7358 [Dentipellis fragilis]|uniref:Fungal lipase-type domain-containing protein n=1 Tax=Dentipellis fragilis TaxID=205917 RepID=A0A4Y9YGD5_9AGAM|nr:hypothetical protein EVG20_g7358 [Dentipellis fragilis]